MPKANGDVTTLDLFSEPVAPRRRIRIRTAQERERNNQRKRERTKTDPEFRARKRAIAKAWREANPERARENKERFLAKNKDYARDYGVAYREKNRDRLKAANKQWSQNNREKARAAQKRYREAHKPRILVEQRVKGAFLRSKYPLRHMLFGAKTRARKSGLDFDLTEEWAKARWTGRCEITGLEFVKERRRAGMFTASIDRIDNSKGYTQDNCRIVLWAINRLKGESDDTTMLMIARALVAKADATNNGE